MPKKAAKSIKLNKEMFKIDANLDGKIEHSMTPEILRVQEELKAIISKIPIATPPSTLIALLFYRQ